jgi:octaprenyl-diphosphate synthase
MGAKSVGAPAEEVERMRKFGELIGMAFQIKDDLFDYGEEKIGKPTGIDIKEKKMTLPLIYALNNSDSKERRWLINSIKNHNMDRKRVKEVIAYVKKIGGLDYATKKMKEYRSHALEILSDYPKSDYKDSLELMVNYVIDRKK